MSSSYTLTFSDPSTTTTITVPGVTVGPGINNYDTSLDLVGPGYVDYGRPFAQNFLKLLENFAGPNPPLHAIKGQLWYDISNPASPVLRIHNGELTSARWPSANGIYQQPTDPYIRFTTLIKEGDVWVDTGNNQLKIRYSDEWTVVGPSVQTGVNKSGTEPVLLESNTGTSYPVILNWVSGKVVEIISYASFTPRTVIDGFGTVKAGTNLTTKVAAKYNGLAEKASALEVSAGVLINASEVLRNRVTEQIHTGTFYVESTGGLYIRRTPTADPIRVYSNSNAAFVDFLNTSTSATLKVGIQDKSYLKFDSTYNSVGINKSPTYPYPTLDVEGSGRFLNTLTVSVTATISLSVPNGGALFGGTVASNGLMVTGQTTSTDKMTLGSSGSGVILEPAIHDRFDIGTTSTCFREIHARDIHAIQFYGTLTGAASSLASLREFNITGQISAPPQSFNGTSTTTFVTSLTRDAINDQPTISTATATYTLLVLDTANSTTSLEKISKPNFLSDVYPGLFLPGMITAYGTSTNIPSGWLVCNGVSVPVGTYTNLYSIIGDVYNTGLTPGFFRTPNMTTSTHIGSAYVTYIIKT